MKKRFFPTGLFLLLTATFLNGQMHIQSGAMVTCTGSPMLALNNISWEILGGFAADQSTVLMNGTANGGIHFPSGTRTIQNLELAKTGGGYTFCDFSGGSTYLDINGELRMNGGQFRVQNGNVRLPVGASTILNETETNRITTSSVGSISKDFDFISPPFGVNPGNLGFEITATIPLGTMTIVRQNAPIAGLGAGGSSVARSFYLTTASLPPDLNATMRIKYFDAELSGNAEPNLSLWFDENGGQPFEMLGVTAANSTTNFVEYNNVDELFGNFTLAQPIVLPIELLDFSARKTGATALVEWATASESEVDFFQIEHSSDAASGLFQPIGRVATAGNSSTERRYDLEHTRPSAGLNFYRLRTQDRDGSEHFSKIVALHFGQNGRFLIAPNPTISGAATLFFDAETEGDLPFEIFDARGGLVQNGLFLAKKGENAAAFDFSNLPSGGYFLRMQERTIRLVIE